VAAPEYVVTCTKCGTVIDFHADCDMADEEGNAPLTVTPPEGAAAIRRQAYLAYLFLDVVTCPSCHLPKARGYVCPCGADE
jgi:hypothetical protein